MRQHSYAVATKAFADFIFLRRLFNSGLAKFLKAFFKRLSLCLENDETQVPFSHICLPLNQGWPSSHCSCI